MACVPLLINPAETYGKNSVIDGVITMSGKGQATKSIVETIGVKLRANGEGKIVNYDLSPIVASICRKHFEAGVEAKQYTHDYSYNTWYLSASINGISVISSDAVLFGSTVAPQAETIQPHLLRRNTATIHVYQNLPGCFVEVSPMVMRIYDQLMNQLRDLSGNAPIAATYYFDNLGLQPGRYYLSGDSPFNDTEWKDGRTWRDMDIWSDDPSTVKTDAVFYPLVVHPDPSDCIRAGAKIYVRYWNSRGAWSYALLDVLHNDLKAKTEYADAWRLDANPVNGRIFGDRVQTDKEMTYTITAGRDGLDRLDVDELRDMQRAYCVQVWDVVREVWRDCYVQDATTQNNGGRGQEMTFTIEMPHEYTFTR